MDTTHTEADAKPDMLAVENRRLRLSLAEIATELRNGVKAISELKAEIASLRKATNYDS